VPGEVFQRVRRLFLQLRSTLRISDPLNKASCFAKRAESSQRLPESKAKILLVFYPGAFGRSPPPLNRKPRIWPLGKKKSVFQKSWVKTKKHGGHAGTPLQST
jgi:hypothetical protein